MTNEQIEQNAEEYAKKHYDIPFEDNSSMNVIISEESYIAGAHSQDEEIKELKKKVSALETIIVTEKAVISTQEAIIKDLRNPWISVKDGFPKEGKCVFVRYGDITHSLYSSAYMIEKDLWSIEGYGNGEVTHWMPIPELEEGE